MFSPMRKPVFLLKCFLPMISAAADTSTQARKAMLRGADFILLAQMPAPQPAWAQLYNARMEPAWARRFELPSITGCESVGTCRTLLDLYLATGTEKYLKVLAQQCNGFKKAP